MRHTGGYGTTKKKYEGVCYDGPWEGRIIAHDYPWIRITIAPPISVFDPIVNLNDTISYTIAIYKWQRDLRKWVFDPRGT